MPELREEKHVGQVVTEGQARGLQTDAIPKVTEHPDEGQPDTAEKKVDPGGIIGVQRRVAARDQDVETAPVAGVQAGEQQDGGEQAVAQAGHEFDKPVGAQDDEAQAERERWAGDEDQGGHAGDDKEGAAVPGGQGQEDGEP